MAVLSVVTNPTGLVGVGNYLSASQLPSSVTAGPSVIYINTNDTFATVTAANYLTKYRTDFGNVFAPGQMAATYTTDQGTVWLQVTISGSNVSLVEPAVGGFVAVPTVANQIAYATNTLGALGASGVATALFNGGDISAGKSGTAGALFSFPGTALRGSLKLAATASAGNTVTTITNASQAAARTYTIPDAGTNSSFLMTDSGGTQAIATGSLSLTLGNLTVAAGSIAATLGSVSAGTTVTGGTGVTASTGNIEALQGNVLAGSSGHQGVVAAFPAGAAAGRLVLSAVGNTGNTDVTISNAIHGQASVYTIADAGTATGGIVVTPTSAIVMKSVANAAVAGGAPGQTVTDAFCTSASTVVANWRDTTNPASILTVAAGNGSFVVTSSVDPGASHIDYIITK